MFIIVIHLPFASTDHIQKGIVNYFTLIYTPFAFDILLCLKSQSVKVRVIRGAKATVLAVVSFKTFVL